MEPDGPGWLRSLTIGELDTLDFACVVTLERYNGTEQMERVSELSDHVLAEVERRDLPRASDLPRARQSPQH